MPTEAPRTKVTFTRSALSAKTVNDARSGAQAVFRELTNRFGGSTIICGRDPASFTTAATLGLFQKFHTSPLLDCGESAGLNHTKARTMVVHTKGLNLTIAYGHHKILNKVAGRKNSTKIGLKPGSEAMLLYLNGEGRVIGVDKQHLLPTA